MFDDFRLNVISELAIAGLDDVTMRRVMNVVDRVTSDYNVERKCTALIPISDTTQRILLEYLSCKSLEGFSKETLRNYHNILSMFLVSINKQVVDIVSNDIRSYLYQYQEVRKVSNRTLDHMRTTLNGFFHWLFAEGKIEKDPTLAIKPIRYVVRPKPSLSQLDMEYIRKTLGTPKEKAIIEIMYSTGCRVSELCGMKLSDIDWDQATVLIFGKGGKYRTGYLNAKSIVALHDYLESRTDNDEHLIVSDRRPYGALKRHAIEKIVRNVSERAYAKTGIHVTPHIFRHTTISTALHNGMPLQLVSKMVGHANVKTTMDYAKINNSDVKYEHAKYVI